MKNMSVKSQNNSLTPELSSPARFRIKWDPQSMTQEEQEEEEEQEQDIIIYFQAKCVNKTN